MTAQHSTLISRIEAASGGDRELDALIFRAIGAPVPFQFANKLVALTFDEERQAYFAPVGDMQVQYEPPAYTSSIDAAMTLVPEGWSVLFVWNGERCVADVHSKPIGDPEGVWPAHSRAATPALALCAAALKAREPSA